MLEDAMKEHRERLFQEMDNVPWLAEWTDEESLYIIRTCVISRLHEYAERMTRDLGFVEPFVFVWRPAHWLRDEFVSPRDEHPLYYWRGVLSLSLISQESLREESVELPNGWLTALCIEAVVKETEVQGMNPKTEGFPGRFARLMLTRVEEAVGVLRHTVTCELRPRITPREVEEVQT